MTNTDKIKAFFHDGILDLGWSLETSCEYEIEANFKEDFDCEPTDSDWDEISDSIKNFESHYDSILKEYVARSGREEGHDSNDDLCGTCFATLGEVINIMNGGEQTNDNQFTFTSSSGRFYPDCLDVLHQSVNASLTFYLPDELVNLIEYADKTEINALVSELTETEC